MIVDIIGSSFTACLYDWERDSIKWSVGPCFKSYGDRIDLYFCLHPGENIDYPHVIKQADYPLDEIMERHNSAYFNNSIAYMMIYAFEQGATEINLFGIDVESDSEYAFERPCIAYWTGYLKAKGVKINHNSNLSDPPFKYGFDQENLFKFRDQLQDRAKAYRLHAENETDEARKNQFIGAMFATEKIINLIRG